MATKRVSLMSVSFSFIFAIALGYSGWNSYKLLNDKADNQIKALGEFNQWKSAYQELLPIKGKWDASFKQSKEAKDLLTIHGYLTDYIDSKEVTINPDTISVTGIDRFLSNGIDIGLSKVCLSSNGAAGLLLHSSSHAALLEASKKLSTHKDVMFERITVGFVENKPTVELRNFCLLLKD